MATSLTLMRCPRMWGYSPQLPGRTPIYSEMTGNAPLASGFGAIRMPVDSMETISPQIGRARKAERLAWQGRFNFGLGLTRAHKGRKRPVETGEVARKTWVFRFACTCIFDPRGLRSTWDATPGSKTMVPGTSPGPGSDRLRDAEIRIRMHDRQHTNPTRRVGLVS
jgi:hypothetical protein